MKLVIVAPNAAEVGKQLKFLRKGHSLKQGDAAKALGMSQASLSRVESGKQKVDLELLQKLADLYKITDGRLLWLVRGI